MSSRRAHGSMANEPWQRMCGGSGAQKGGGRAVRALSLSN
jgi:hypothetical protein